MNVLLSHAHPEPKSFCTAMYRMAIQALKEQGHNVQISDLYHQSFNPVAGAADFSERRNSDYLTYALEQRYAYDSDALAADIQGELKVMLRPLLHGLGFRLGAPSSCVASISLVA
jgi:NAD(P)H dehydrogenase (quinone)